MDCIYGVLSDQWPLKVITIFLRHIHTFIHHWCQPCKVTARSLGQLGLDVLLRDTTTLSWEGQDLTSGLLVARQPALHPKPLPPISRLARFLVISPNVLDLPWPYLALSYELH